MSEKRIDGINFISCSDYSELGISLESYWTVTFLDKKHGLQKNQKGTKEDFKEF